VKSSQAKDFTVSFRIPACATGASISVNGRVQAPATQGCFVAIHRQWSTGDRVELDMPMSMRLEAVDQQHQQTVARVYGPLVLFAITDTQPVLTRADLLAARRMDQRSWQVKTASAPIKILPFTDIGEEQYSTYLRVTYILVPGFGGEMRPHPSDVTLSGLLRALHSAPPCQDSACAPER
jgi:hypothetical protein